MCFFLRKLSQSNSKSRSFTDFSECNIEKYINELYEGVGKKVYVTLRLFIGKVENL